MKNTLFINLSNHPSQHWSLQQVDRVHNLIDVFSIIDIPFPEIDPDMSTNEVYDLAQEYIDKINDILRHYEVKDCIVHIMGEMTFVYEFVYLSKTYYQNICCVASTTRRSAIEGKDGKKVSIFEFVNFRKY